MRGLGGFPAPGSFHHVLAQEVLDGAFGYSQNQAPAPVTCAFRTEANHTWPIREISDDGRRIDAQPLSDSGGSVKAFVR